MCCISMNVLHFIKVKGLKVWSLIQAVQAKIQIQNCFKITAINNVCDFGLNLLQIWTFGIGLSENKYSAQDYVSEHMISMVV